MCLEIQPLTLVGLDVVVVRNILGEEGEKADLLCSGPTLAMELVMEDAVNKFAQLANNKVATLLFPRNLTQHSIGY